jgi:ketosteroid isomerase-like protein
MTSLPPVARTLIERYLEIVANDDYAAFGELLTDDCEFRLMPTGHVWKGRERVMNVVTAAGGSRAHDDRSKVEVTNWFTNDEYLVVEYEHSAIVARLLHFRIDGYCWVFHIRDGRFDSMREYINPGGLVTTLLLSLALRALPLLSRLRARRSGPA